MATWVAVTVPELSVPKTATCSPTFTSAMVGELTPGSKYVVELSTSTVTVVPSWAVTVKMSVAHRLHRAHSCRSRAVEGRSVDRMCRPG